MLTCIILALLMGSAPSADYSLVAQPFDFFPVGGLVSATSHDGRLAITGGYDRTLRLWHLPTGRVLRVITSHNREIVDVAFSADDKSLYSMDELGMIFWHDAATGAKQGYLSTDGMFKARSFAVSSDGKMAASVSKSEIKLWDLASKGLLRTLPSKDPSRPHEPEKMFFTPDGKHLATWDGSRAIVFDAATGASVCADAIGNFDALVKSCEAAKGPTRAELSRAHAGKKVTESDREKFAPVARSAVFGLRFIPRTHSLTFTSDTNRTVIVDLESGRGVRPGPALSGAVWPLAGKQMMGQKHLLPYQSNKRVVQIRDVATDLLIREHDLLTPEGTWLLETRVALSNDGALIAAIDQQRILFYDSVTGKLIRTVPGLPRFYGSFQFSTDDKRLLVLSTTSAAGYSDGWFAAYDVATGAKVDFESISPPPDKDLRTSNDGRYASWYNARAILVRDLNGKTTRSVPRDANSMGYAFSPDGRTLAMGTNRGRIDFFDLAEGRVVRSVEGNEGSRELAYSDDGRFLAATGWSDVLMLWNLKTDGRVTMSFSDHDWIAYTRDGYFDGSKDGGRLVAIVKQTTAFGVDQFAARLNRPDVLLERLELGTPELLEHYRQQHRKRLKRLGVTEESLGKDLAAPDAAVTAAAVEGKFVALSFTCKDDRSSIDHYSIFVNDVPLFGASGAAVPATHSLSQEAKVELTNGSNKIEVSCRNGSGAESYRALTSASYKPDPVRDLYFIGFGVSQYQRKELNLSFAHKDAKDLAALFSRPRKGIGQAHVKAYLDQEVTAASIAEAKKLLRTAKPDDIFVLFIAGHGVHDDDAEATYYFLTHDADPAALAKTAANFESVEDLLQGIAPREKLFLMDTCESGESEGSAVAVATANAVPGAISRGIRKSEKRAAPGSPAAAPPARAYLQARERYIYNDLVRRSGAVVFSSSRGGELSYEDSALANGYFTAEILRALSTPDADANGDKEVSFDELRAFVSRAVAERSHGLQTPTVDRDNLYQRISLPLPSAEPPAPPPTPKRSKKGKKHKKG